MPPEEIIPNCEEILPAVLRIAANAAALDYDFDGVDSLHDNCPGTPNFPQNDRDGDLRGDVCDRDRDVWFFLPPSDITKLVETDEPVPDWEVVSTGRARVKVQALEAAYNVPDTGSDLHVHWCDCQGQNNTFGSSADGSGAKSDCRITFCDWNNNAGISLIAKQGYYPISYSVASEVQSPTDPPGDQAFLPDEADAGPWDFDGFEEIATATIDEVAVNPSVPNCEMDEKSITIGDVTYYHDFCRQLDDRKYLPPPESVSSSSWDTVFWAAPGQTHELIWHWEDEEWWADPYLQPLRGFLWARSGWHGGHDAVEVSDTLDVSLHERTELTTDDGLGAWSRGYVPGVSPQNEHGGDR